MAIYPPKIFKKLSGFSFFETFKRAGVYFSGTILVQGLGIISLPILTYFLTEEEYGIANVYMSYSLIASALLSLNLEWSVSRYFLEPDADKKGFMATIISSVSFLFILTSSIIFFFKGPISAIINLPENLILWLLLSTYTNIIWFTYLLLRVVENRSKEMTFMQVLTQYLKFGAGVAGIVIIQQMDGEPYLGKIMGEFVINMIMTAWFLYILWPYCDFKRTGWSHLRYAAVYAIPLVPYALGGQVLSSFDQWYINSALGHEKAGLYSFAAKIGLLMSGLQMAFQNASLVQYTKWMEEGMYKETATQAFSIHKMTILAGLFLILFSVDAGTLLSSKPTFREALGIVPIIVMGYIFYSIALLYGRAFNFKKINIYLTGILLTAAALNIFLNSVYIPIYGYEAAAFTTLISYALMAFLAWVISTFWLKLPPIPIGKMLFSLLPIIVISWAFYSLGWQKIGLHWGIIFIKGSVFAVFAFILFYKTILKVLGRQ